MAFVCVGVQEIVFSFVMNKLPMKKLFTFTEKVVMQRNYDGVLLKSVVNFFSFTGTFPPVKFYKLIFLIPYQTISIIVVAKGHIDLYNSTEHSFIGIILYLQNVLLGIIFSLLCLKNSYHHDTLWKDFYKDVDMFDVEVTELVSTPDELVFKYYLKFIFFIVLYTTMHSLTLFASERRYQDAVGIFYFYFVCIQILGSILVFEKVLKLLEKRYDFLIKKTKQRFLGKKTDTVFWKDQQLKVLCFHLKNMVKKINKLFGQRILLLLILTFLDVLGSFQFLILEESPIFRNLNMFVSLGGQLIMFWVS